MNKKILLKRMRSNPFFVIGLFFALILVLLTMMSPLYVHYDPLQNALMEKFQPPEWFARGMEGHILGTDQMGRDILSRLMIGGRISLTIAFSAVAIMTFVGTVLGIIAGYFGGIVDSIIMRLCDVCMAIPPLILAVSVMSVLGVNTFNLILVVAFSQWVGCCRVTRNNVRVVKSMEFVHASEVLGAKKSHIMFRQIFPNVTTQIIIIASQKIGLSILLEASLSFLSLGVPAPQPSWGNMIAAGRSYMMVCPWLVIVPGIALMITVLAFNFLGDGLRDILDPKMD